MGKVTVNGTTYHVPSSGGSISVRGNSVFVDGKPISEGLVGIVEIKWEGPLVSLQADGDVTCGDVAGNVSSGGSLSAKNVGGSACAGGSLTCENVTGNVSAGGSVRCGPVGGRVDAGGSVRHG